MGLALLGLAAMRWISGKPIPSLLLSRHTSAIRTDRPDVRAIPPVVLATLVMMVFGSLP